MASSIKDDLRSFRRSWVHHTGMQLATLTVLAATMSVIAFSLSLSMNLRRILANWGDGVQITAYLNDELSSDEGDSKGLYKKLEALPGVKEVTFVPREKATENFKQQMASYAPDLLSDAEFANPFPASFRISIKGGVESDRDVQGLEAMASVIRKMPGVEDVTYGESWVRNYSSFVTSLYATSGVMAFILLAGALFVVGNSIRTSISARREEIEILELVGATASMIRRPFVTEGAIMGGLSAVLALVLNLGIYLWQKSMLSTSFVLARIMPNISFLSPSLILIFVLIGGSLGAFGAWITVRKINDGWSASASRGVEI